MHLQKWGLGKSCDSCADDCWFWWALWVGAASGQNSTNSANVAKPCCPTRRTPPSPAEPAAPDTTPPRVDATFNPDTFVIGVEDVLNINVWKEPELSRTVPVRPDGMITLPLIGEIKAKGLTPVQLQDQITDSLKKSHVGPSGDGDRRRGPEPDL